MRQKRKSPAATKQPGNSKTFTADYTPAKHCPRWHSCNAPICPLDSDWPSRVMRRDEPVCPYLLQAARNKPLVQKGANMGGIV